jgi:uncharacterized protein (TIGR02391 family)
MAKVTRRSATKRKAPHRKKLAMSFDPHTIEHLGIKMYSNLPNAIAELIANAYDADSKKVRIKLFDEGGNKKIEISDDGVGMDLDEVNEKFLRIGRKRREESSLKSPSGKRKVTGRKGLGKLAFFGIGTNIEITTIKINSSKKIIFNLDWNSILATQGKDYEPPYEIYKCEKKLKGTTITLTELNRKSAFDKQDLADSISKLFNFFDNDFQVLISLNNDKETVIDNKLKYKSINQQFQWNFPGFLKYVNAEYDEKEKIKGKVFSTDKPLKPGLRGVTLFANGRLVNASEFFGVSESSHGFSYFSGWLDIDFVDDWKEDVISTDRQSLNWDLPKTTELREFLKKVMSELERKWREKRNENRREKITGKTNVDIPNWFRNLPPEVLSNMEPVINKIIDDSELSEEEQTDVVQKLNSLVPSYPYYHWRHINDEIRKVSSKYYENKDYYTAFIEALKRYVSEVKKKSGLSISEERGLIQAVFGGKKLSVTKKFRKRDGNPFDVKTIENIETGQHYLSEGIVVGGRHPLQHEEHIELNETGLFSEKDCLDFLSLLSHLFKRLQDAEAP